MDAIYKLIDEKLNDNAITIKLLRERVTKLEEENTELIKKNTELKEKLEDATF